MVNIRINIHTLAIIILALARLMEVIKG